MSNDPSRELGAKQTTDVALVRSIVDERGGYPAHVPKTEGQGDAGLLRIGKYGREEDLKEISWDTFEEEFQEKDLVFVYSEDGTDADVVGELRKRPDG